MGIDESSVTALPALLEHSEAAAYADLLRAAPASWRCEAERTSAGWSLLAPNLDLLLFNRLLGIGIDAPIGRPQLFTALERYRSAGLTQFGVQVSPLALPRELGGWLREDGLTPHDSWSKVYRGAGPVPEVVTDLRIEAAGRADADDVATITCAAFGMPSQLESWIASMVGRAGWHHYLVSAGSARVAAGALFVVGNVGWLGIAGTLPGARRQGAQSLLVSRRLADGLRLGCRWFVTEAAQELPDRPNPSYHNLMRAGFVLAYHRPNYLANPH